MPNVSFRTNSAVFSNFQTNICSFTITFLLYLPLSTKIVKRNEIFYLMTHSTHLFHDYVGSDILMTTQIMR